VSRFLFVSLPLTGHVNPIAALARVLSSRGHEVAWAGSERFLRPLVGPDALIHPIPLRVHRGGQAELGMAAAKSRWEGYIVPHARSTLRGVDRAAAEFRPDVMVVDQHAVAGALVAHRRGLTWAGVAPTTMELTRPYRALPKVESWLLGLLDGLWADAGLPGPAPHDLRFSPHLLIAFTGTALVGELSWPDNAALVGPAIEPRPADVGFPWDWLDPGRKHVLVTMGTLSMDLAESFYRRMAQALEPLGDRLQAVVVAPEYAIPDPPAHVLVLRQVPMLDLMPRLDAVVSHGGLNTVCEALAHGLPLVVAPIKGDQPINAAQVAAAGAGIRVRFARTRPEPLRDAVLAVLEDPSYRAAAERVRESFHAAGGAAAAADLLEDLAARSAPRTAGKATERAAERMQSEALL
jgi:UDP:flavonoid glycosyltransferase YjiC (YdhE family)